MDENKSAWLVSIGLSFILALLLGAIAASASDLDIGYMFDGDSDDGEILFYLTVILTAGAAWAVSFPLLRKYVFVPEENDPKNNPNKPSD